MIDQLSERIWAHELFHEDAAVLRKSLLESRYVARQPLPPDATLIRLLRSAAILAASQNHIHRHAAYEIATAAAELQSEEYPGVPFVLLLVLARMGNFPALTYARKRFAIDEAQLPTRQVVETSERTFQNSIAIGTSTITLTDFQLELWSKLNTGSSLGVSAPTSAGKSFILQTYARKLLTDKIPNNVAFLVPTRALINQVSEEVSAWLQGNDLNVELITTPIPQDSELPKRGAYVLTQERLQLIQTAHADVSFELMLIDEAQSIADGPRGILLLSVIDEALARNPRTQLLFAGPNIRNPGSIATLFGRESQSVTTDEATVSQNIIFVDCDPEKPNVAKLALRSDDRRVALGTIECDQPLIDHKSKLINLALRLGAGGQNLIYAMGPAECEEVAFGLADTEEAAPEHAALNELSGFIKEAIHPKYQLARNVLRRVGFHYGRLPSLVRKTIEDAFANGELQFLVTTSTLLYGVNLPAQNLFLQNPQKGQNRPISAIDFWNLAGRAGRLGREFSGNIFLIDYGEWPNDPIVGNKEQIVKPAITQHVVDRAEELIAYIRDSSRIPDRQKPDELENTFVRLVRDYFEGKLDETLDRVGLHQSDPRHGHLVEAVAGAVKDIDIDPETVNASPTVSIHRQQSLYERLEESFKKKGPGHIIPRHPLDAQAYNSYFMAIKRCHDEVLRYPRTEKSHFYYAQIALRWIRGEPLPQIIDASYRYKERRGHKPKIGTVIRGTLSEVENDLRFKYVRLFSCYNAVLEQVLRDNTRSDLVASIPAVPMYLEVGACSPTMISFMGLGLSRYTAGKLQTLPRRKDMSQNEARNWILRQDVDGLNLPSASVKEIRRMVFES